MSVAAVPRGRARRSGDCSLRCRNEINAVVFLCLAETDAVSACVQHDIPARWSEQVPDSFLRALCEIAFWAGFVGNAGQEGDQLAQETPASRFPAGLGFIDRLCLSLDRSIFYY